MTELPTSDSNSPGPVSPAQHGVPSPLLGGGSDLLPGRLLACTLIHLTGLGLTLIALLAVAWFFYTNPALLPIFGQLLKPWHLGDGGFDFHALAWTAGALALFLVIGLLYLEGHELYIPRSARIALGLLFGMGLCGFVFELLAIPYLLYRPMVALGMGALLIVLGVRAWRRARQPPEADAAADSGPAEAHLRVTLGREAFEHSLNVPNSIAARLFRTALLTLIGLITLAIFWHAVLYPEVYWDSLILYLGYARMTFLEHGFPVKVVGQVGIGLGANYPHLFSALGSAIAAAMGSWSELPQRIIAPLCGLASTLLVYHTALRLTRHVNFSLAIALLYRALPLTIAWDQYASDYALVLLFGAGWLYLAVLHLQTRLRGYLWAATLLIALALHLNYLMGILAAPWLVLLFATHAGRRTPGRDVPPPDDPAFQEWRYAPWTVQRRSDGLLTLLRAPSFLMMLLACAAIGSIWFIRNLIVTGNPVYAFFYETLGGKNINPEVMRGAAVEWQANGWGIGVMGASLYARIMGAWHYFVTATPRTGGGQAYLTQPLLLGFTLAGCVVWAALLVVTPWARAQRPTLLRDAVRFGWVVLTLFVALLAFHFIMAPFYLYQIIKLAPCMALLAALAWPVWRVRPWRWCFAALVLTTGLVPGLAMALMGFKITGPFTLPGGRIENPLTLYPLRNPLPRAEIYYRMRFGDDARMWEYVNANLRGRKLLTHENRHLVFDSSVTIVHLDDWDMQQLWNEPDPIARVRRLVNQYGIQHYLFIPNEKATPTNARMGTAEWERLGLMKLLHQAGDSRLYELTPANAVTTATAMRTSATLPLAATIPTTPTTTVTTALQPTTPIQPTTQTASMIPTSATLSVPIATGTLTTHSAVAATSTTTGTQPQ